MTNSRCYCGTILLILISEVFWPRLNLHILVPKPSYNGPCLPTLKIMNYTKHAFYQDGEENYLIQSKFQYSQYFSYNGTLLKLLCPVIMVITSINHPN